MAPQRRRKKLKLPASALFLQSLGQLPQLLKIVENILPTAFSREMSPAKGNSIVKAYLRDKPEKMLTKLASSDTVVVHALEPPVPMQFIYSKDWQPETRVRLQISHVFHRPLYRAEASISSGRQHHPSSGSGTILAGQVLIASPTLFQLLSASRRVIWGPYVQCTYDNHITIIRVQ